MFYEKIPQGKKEEEEEEGNGVGRGEGEEEGLEAWGHR